jgi:DNA polymerase III delta prime subunit
VEQHKEFIFKKPTTKKQLILEDMDNNFNIDNVDTLTEINNYNSNNLKILIEKQQLKEVIETRYNNLLEIVNKNNPKHLNTVTIGTGLRIKAIKKYVEGYGQYEKTDYILITTKNKCYYSQKSITELINTWLNNKTLIMSKYGFIKVYNNEAMFSFVVGGLSQPWKGRTYAEIVNMALSPELKKLNEEDEQITNKLNSMSDIELNNLLITDIFKIKNCINIDELKENEIITVAAIKKRGIGKKDKYIIFTEEHPNIAYVSNPFLELQLQLCDISKIKTKFKILIGPYRTTSSKKQM